MKRKSKENIQFKIKPGEIKIRKAVPNPVVSFKSVKDYTRKNKKNIEID
jgi:hypothetical protein